MSKILSIKHFRAGVHQSQGGYRSFIPNEINFQWQIDTPSVTSLLEEANHKLGQLNAFSFFVPDVDIYVRMYITKEATTSSKIEGTQTEMDEAVLSEKYVSPEKRDDWEEVQNYIKAINTAIKELKKLPLSNRLLKSTHKILLDGVRGKHKSPGEFRRSQNWIGGSSLKDAMFIPPPAHDVPPLMSDLEKFLHNTEIEVPHLIRIAIAHYQFETIHPFLDGNGRLGRLLITLYLVSNKILDKPSLYLSAFFEKHRQLYYDNLSAARTNNLEQWIKFFLVGIIETADNSADTFKNIIKLKENIETKRLTKLGKRLSLGNKLMEYLYKNPVITVNMVIDELEITKPTANAIIREFLNLKILTEQTGYKRNRIFMFKEYLEIFKSK